jgi:hypothetical protein
MVDVVDEGRHPPLADGRVGEGPELAPPFDEPERLPLDDRRRQLAGSSENGVIRQVLPATAWSRVLIACAMTGSRIIFS